VAWVLFAFSVVLAVFELWVNSPAIGTFNFFGLVDGPEEIETFVLLIYGVWLLVGVVDVVFLFVLKGRRNRIVVLGGLVALIVPLLYIFWRLNS
jgi:hypothetical protein